METGEIYDLPTELIGGGEMLNVLACDKFIVFVQIDEEGKCGPGKRILKFTVWDSGMRSVSKVFYHYPVWLWPAYIIRTHEGHMLGGHRVMAFVTSYDSEDPDSDAIFYSKMQMTVVGKKKILLN